MRIGFDAKRAYHNFSGLGNYSRDIIRHLVNQYPEHQYFVYSPKPNVKANVDFLNKENVFERLPKSTVDKAFKSIWRSVGLEKHLIKDKIDIYHGLSNEIPKRKSTLIKYVVTIHDLIFKRYPEIYKTADRKIYDAKFKYAANNSDLIIAISEQTKKDIIEFYDIDSNKIEVLYQTCHHNFKKAYNEKEKETIKSKYNLPDKYLLNVGTIESRKNLKSIIKALPLIEENIPLFVVGKKTDYYNEVLREIDNLKLTDRVHFLENISIDELPIIYQLASVFVYPSIFEGFGIPIIESLFSGTPVITSKNGCFPEAGGPNSIYVESTNENEIAVGIDKILANSTLSNEMINKGKEYAIKNFDDKKLSQQLVDIYQELLR